MGYKKNYKSGNTVSAKDRKKEAEENIRKLVLDGLKKGKNVWEMPWISKACRQKSFATGKPYHGSNAFILSIISAMRGYTDSRWITFEHMKQAGGHFVCDADGAGVKVFHINFKKKEQEDGKIVEEFSGISMSTVFNLSITSLEPEKIVAPFEFSPDEIGERMLSVSPVEITYGGNRACYIPSVDKIHLPMKDFFKSTSGFYGTAFHEMTHSTGAKKRLDRDLSGVFGSREYAAEELVAEVGSVLLCAQLGIELEQKDEENHTAYLLSWLESCELSDFMSALKKAEDASDYLYDRYVSVYGAPEYGTRVNVLKYGTVGNLTGLCLLPVHEVAV